jgi:hypothetical protein
MGNANHELTQNETKHRSKAKGHYLMQVISLSSKEDLERYVNFGTRKSLNPTVIPLMTAEGSGIKTTL